MNREAVYSALFGLLSPLVPGTLATVQRRARALDDFSTNELPALMQFQTMEDKHHVKGLPPVYTFKVDWYLGCEEQDESIAPSTKLNNLTDQVLAVLKPDYLPRLSQTLNRQVERVWVSGPIDTYEGAIRNRSLSIIPISIQVVGSPEDV